MFYRAFVVSLAMEEGIQVISFPFCPRQMRLIDVMTFSQCRNRAQADVEESCVCVCADDNDDNVEKFHERICEKKNLSFRSMRSLNYR